MSKRLPVSGETYFLIVYLRVLLNKRTPSEVIEVLLDFQRKEKIMPRDEDKKENNAELSKKIRIRDDLHSEIMALKYRMGFKKTDSLLRFLIGIYAEKNDIKLPKID